MKLPGAERAVIDSRKLRDYVLSRTHPVGRYKAAVFAALGFTDDNWEELEAALRKAAVEGDAELDESTPYGEKYRLRSILQGPIGAPSEIVSVWIVRHGDDRPHLVTVMPGR